MAHQQLSLHVVYRLFSASRLINPIQCFFQTMYIQERLRGTLR